jgi:hypothetical protein
MTKVWARLLPVMTTHVMGLVPMTLTSPRTQPDRTRTPVQPLLTEDPPRIGRFWLRGRVVANAAGLVYAGRDDDGGIAAIAMMAEGAADDAAARERFAHAVDRLPIAVVLDRNSADDDDLALWVAVTDPDATRSEPQSETDSEPESGEVPPEVSPVARGHATDVLSAVLMDRVPHLGRVRGPDFRHHWDGRRRPGLFRLWPLPWPAALRTASRLALLLSLLTMLLLMALALLIAWLLFRNQPEVDPGPVIPNPTGTSTVTVTPSQPSTPTTGPSPTGGSPSNGPSSPTSPSNGPLPTRIPSSGGTPADPGDRF